MTRDDLLKLVNDARSAAAAYMIRKELSDDDVWDAAITADTRLAEACYVVLPELLRRLDLAEQALAAVVSVFWDPEPLDVGAQPASIQARDALAAIRAPLDAAE